jgi:hypothetical protein
MEVETNPDPADVALLADRIAAHTAAVTGHDDTRPTRVPTAGSGPGAGIRWSGGSTTTRWATPRSGSPRSSERCGTVVPSGGGGRSGPRWTRPPT